MRTSLSLSFHVRLVFVSCADMLRTVWPSLLLLLADEVVAQAQEQHDLFFPHDPNRACRHCFRRMKAEKSRFEEEKQVEEAENK